MIDETAKLFAASFQEKWVYRVSQKTCYSCQLVSDARPSPQFFQVRSRATRFFLASLDAARATGPDGLPTILLRGLAQLFCFPFARYVLFLLGAGFVFGRSTGFVICTNENLAVLFPITGSFN